MYRGLFVTLQPVNILNSYVAMKKILLSIFLAVTANALAQTVTTVDDIRYLIEDDHAVVGRQDKELAGDITIPASISYNGSDYSVTAMVEPTNIVFYGDNTVRTENGAFQDCAITGITLPASIKVVTAGAFQDCAQLVSVTLPEGLTTLAPGCFARCTRLKSVNLPSTVNNLGSDGNNSYVFGGCTGLETVNIPEGVTRILAGCFKNTAVKEFVLPAGLQELGSESLASTALTLVKTGVTDLRTLSCPEDVFADVSEATLQVPYGSQYIYREHEPWMFFKAMELYGDPDAPSVQPDQRNVEVGEVKYLIKLTDEGSWAEVKRQDPSLSGSIVIPENINFEGTDYPVNAIVQPRTKEAFATGEFVTTGGAFQGTQITELRIPASIETIPPGAFADCQQLTTVTVADGVRQLGAGSFSGCTSLTSVALPASITNLGGDTEFGYWSYVFGGCTALKTIDIPAGVNRLGKGLLKGSAMETLTIPATVVNIEDYSLDLPQLTTLNLVQEDMHQLKVSGHAFGDDNSYLKQADLIVPLGSRQVYGEYYPWLDFHSVSDVKCPYLELDGSILSAPANAFTVEFPEGMADDEKFEVHGNGDYVQGVNLKEGVTIRFTTEAAFSWVYVYLFNGNQNAVLLDGEELNSEGDGEYRRCDRLVEAGTHTITCSTYEGNQWPCMFLVDAQDATADHRFEPDEKTVRIDGVRYILDKDGATASIARQNKSLSGDIVVPEKVKYENKEYTVTAMVAPTYIEAFGDGVFNTADGAFQDCQISSVSLPKTLKTIGVGAFNNCQQLRQVTLAEGIEVLSAASFANCTGLEEIYLPETITDLGSETDYGYWSYVFGGCTSLKKVNTPKLVTQLGQGCFKGSGIETFLIPENITTLAPYCFAADQLKNIKICHKTLTAESITYTESNFADVSGIELIVPEGKTTLYQEFYPWKSFGKMMEFVDQNDEHQYNAYRVAFEDESPAASRGRRAAPAGSDTAFGAYVPSGVAVTDIPERAVNDGIAYVVELKGEAPALMPSTDLVLKAELTRVGDTDKNGKVDIVDMSRTISRIKNQTPNQFFEKAADINNDGSVDADDIAPLTDIILKK